MKTSEQQVPAGRAGASDNMRPDPTHAADIEPTVARGGNVVAVMPPSAGYLKPTLAALSHRTESEGLQLLVLTSHAMLQSVEYGLAEAWCDTEGTVLAVRSAGQAMNLLRQGRVTALVTSPDVALALRARSALPLDSAPTVLLAWPETWDDEDALVGFMLDLPTEAQRILYTAEPDRAERLGERYLRKALVIGGSPHGASTPVVAGPITAASGPGIDIGAAVRQVLDLSEPSSAVVWTALGETKAMVMQALARTPHDVAVTLGTITPAKVIVAADLPQPGDLARLAGAADKLVVIVPGWGLPYLARHASTLKTLRLPGAVDATDRMLAHQRSQIEGLLDAGGSDLERAVYALAPLFERRDPAQVAAALYRLWTTAPKAEPVPAPPPAPAPRAPAQPAVRGRPGPQGRGEKVFVTAGKKDGVTPADFVALLTRDLKVPKEHVGKIEIRETFSLIELPAGEAQAVADGLNGQTIRRRKVVARLERQR